MFCLSEHRDDLSQWRAYSGGEGGYAIQLDGLRLRLSAKQGVVSHFLARVEYNREHQISLFDQALGLGEQLFIELEGRQRAPNLEAWVDEFAPQWLDGISYFAPCLRNPAFQGERECAHRRA